jgi:hypothetical protein
MIDSTLDHHLCPWLHGNLILVNVLFNFDNLKNDFKSKLDNMLRFDDGDLKEYINLSPIISHILILNFLPRWSQFLVIITTHSDPYTEDLHIALNNTGSAPVNKVSFYFSILVLIITNF